MSRSIVSFRMEDNLRDALRAWAQEENRTISNFMESLLLREGERRDGKEVTLDSFRGEILDRLDRMLAGMQKQKQSRKTAIEREQAVLEEVLALEMPSTLSPESWQQWILYQRKKYSNKPDVATANAILDRWQEAANNGHNLDNLVAIAIQRGNKDAVYESHLPKEDPYLRNVK